MPGAPHFSSAAVLLAAGSSTRMGRPKLLLPWGDTSVLGHLLKQWHALGAAQIVVVCALDAKPIQEELDRLGHPIETRIFNPDPARGMFSSIQCAAQWSGWEKPLTHWAIVLGDQPHLRPQTLRAVLDFTASHVGCVCQPSRAGRPRHPVMLPENVFRQLSLTTASNLKDFLRPCASAFCELDDHGLDLDIDRPADYEQALRLARAFSQESMAKEKASIGRNPRQG